MASLLASFDRPATGPSSRQEGALYRGKSLHSLSLIARNRAFERLVPWLEAAGDYRSRGSSPIPRIQAHHSALRCSAGEGLLVRNAGLRQDEGCAARAAPMRLIIRPMSTGRSKRTPALVEATQASRLCTVNPRLRNVTPDRSPSRSPTRPHPFSERSTSRTNLETSSPSSVAPNMTLIRERPRRSRTGPPLLSRPCIGGQ